MYYLARFKAEANFVHPDDVMPISPPWAWYFDEPLGEPMPEVIIRVARIENLMDSWGVGSYECASMRMLDALSSVGETHFELYPVTIIDRADGRDSNGFRVIRFRDRVKCMDMGKSEYELAEEGCVNRVRRLAIHENDIPGDRHFFQLSERSSVQLASEAFASRWSDSRLTGLKFLRLDDVNFWF